MNLRAGIDVDQNLWIDWAGTSPPNLVPDPLWFNGLTVGLALGTTNVFTPVRTNYGLMTHDLTMTAGLDSGASYATITVAPNTTYTAIMWVRTDAITDFFLRVLDSDAGTTIIQQGIAVTPGAWSPLRVVFTTGPTTTHLRLRLGVQARYVSNSGSRYVSASGDPYVSNTSPAAAPTLVSVSGLGVYRGIQTTIDFNSGSASTVSENLTSYLLGADADSGTSTDPAKMIPIDGQALLHLRNTGREFTPRNLTSPYYDKLKRRALVEIQIDRDENGLWEPLWTGFLDRIALDTGTSGQQQAHLTCLQGLMFMDERLVNYVPKVNQTATDMLAEILDGVVLPANRWLWLLDYAKWDDSTWVSGGAATLDLDESAYVYPLAGAGWKDKVTLRSAVNDIITNEAGLAYIGRDGRFVFHTRDVLIPSSDLLGSVAVDAGREFIEAKYEYHGIEATDLRITYTPRQDFTGVFWSTKSQNAIKVPKNSKSEILITPETPEGFKATIFSIVPFKTGASTLSVVKTSSGSKRDVRVLIEPQGQQIKLTFISKVKDDVSITAALSGTGIYEKDSQTITLSDASLLAENDGNSIALDVDLRLVADEDEARSIATHLLAVHRGLVDGIFSATARFGNGGLQRAAASKMAAITVGQVMRITEAQSGVVDMPHLVLGEKFTWSPGQFSINYTLLPLRPTDVWTLDVSTWDDTTKVGY